MDARASAHTAGQAMALETGGKWKLILATFVALGTTAAISAFVAVSWLGDTDQSVVVKRPAPEPTDPAERSVYDLPDHHSGQMVASLDGDRVGLPKLSADYEIDVRGDLATVVVRQRFQNPLDSTVESIYEFPLYSEAAVYAMTLEIGDRRIEAEVKRNEEARKEYEAAKRQGKKAALLAQDRPNLFTQRVANVEAGQTVEITLRYTHPLPKDRGVYQLAVPLAVAERFDPSDMSGNKLVAKDGPADPGASAGGVKKGGPSGPDEVSLSVRIDGGMPVSQIESPSHRIQVETLSETVRRVELADPDDPTARHFRLGFRLAGDETRVGVNSYWDDERERGSFSVLVEPPAEVAAEHVPNREMVFVVDQSGSMATQRMRLANGLVKKTLDHLRPDDHFRIIYFNKDITHYSQQPTPATPANIAEAKSYVDEMHATGGTMMAPAIRAALEPEPILETLRMVTVVTDVAVSNEFEVIETIREHIGESSMFAVGVGGKVNRYLLTEIGRAGRGFSTQFSANEDAQRVIDDAVRRLQKPVMTNISVDWGTLEVEEASPQSPPDVFEGGSVRLHGLYKNPGTHTITVRGKLGGEPVSFEKTVEFADSTQDGEAVELAWARQRIQDHMHSLNTPAKLRADELSDEVLKERITTLGLDYSLTTQWTSLVAIGDEVPAESAQLDVVTRKRRKRVKKRAAPKKIDTKIQVYRGSGSGGSSGASTEGAGVRGMADPGAKKPEAKKPSQGQPEPSKQETAPTPKSDFKIDEIAGQGALDKQIILRVIRVHRRELQYCYHQQQKKDADLKGSLGVTLRIEPNGHVADFETKDSTLGSTAVETCVAKKIQRWVFPEPDNNKPVEVTFTVEFSMQE